MQRNIYISILVLGLVLCTVSTAYVGEHHGDRWRTDLSPEQREKAKEIIQEARPKIKELRKNVQDKMRALQEFCYAEAEDDQALIKLGQELQVARDALRSELVALDNKLMQEVGVSVRGYRGRNSAHLTKESRQDNMLLHKHISNTPHHGEQ